MPSADKKDPDQGCAIVQADQALHNPRMKALIPDQTARTV